ncbi:MAG: hypothetical protein V4557_17015 [Bacteroidota bacterium]
MRNNKFFKIAATFLIVFAALVSCKKEYITGGEIHDVNRYKNTSSYDVLKNIPGYDTLITVIDSAGFKDKINAAGSTFFPPNNSAIFNYLNTRTLALQVGNLNAKFGLDSLLYYVKNNIKGTRDSLAMYLVPAALTYATLNNTGAKYATGLAGDSVVVSYEYVTTLNGSMGYSSNVSSIPQVVYFTQMWYPYTLNEANPAGKIPGTIGVHTLCSTSGINTQNGVMHALSYGHTLFFYGTKK